MRYIDSGTRQEEQTVARWMQQAVESGIDEFRCQSGYFTIEGSSVLLPSLKECSRRGSSLRLVIGSNGGATLASHVSFLAGALGIPQKHVSIGIVAFQTSLFHPKVYHFTRNDGSQSAYVGSANFTGPGISGLNVEAGIILDTREGDDPAHLAQIAAGVERWFGDGQNGVAVVNSAGDIDTLLTNGRLALVPSRQALEPGEEGKNAEQRPKSVLSRLSPIFRLPTLEGFATVGTDTATDELQADSATGPVRRYTEASFHYPQGTHLGHILAILRYCTGERAGGPFDDHFVRLNGGLGEGRLAGFRRQIKYKLLAATELGLLSDIRIEENPANYSLAVTPLGTLLWERLSPSLKTADLAFRTDNDGNLSTVLPKPPAFYTALLRVFYHENEANAELWRSIVLAMPAAEQMLAFLKAASTTQVRKADIYSGFFEFGSVIDFCDQVGIEPQTTESARHRCPFLINLLDSCDLVDQTTQHVTLK